MLIHKSKSVLHKIVKNSLSSVFRKAVYRENCYISGNKQANKQNSAGHLVQTLQFKAGSSQSKTPQQTLCLIELHPFNNVDAPSSLSLFPHG